MTEVKFNIIRHLGVIGEGTKGWKKEVNIISWNDRKPKLDIRDWDEYHEKMGRGITLDKEETLEIKRIFEEFDPDELDE